MALSDTLIDVLKAETIPLTAVQLAKRLLTKAKPKEVVAALDDLTRSGQVFAITQGKGTVYTARPPLDLCAEVLAVQIAAQAGALPPAKVRAALPKTLQPWFDEALGRLIVRGQAYWLPKGRTKLVLGRCVRPSDVIAPAQLAAVRKLLLTANRHRASGRTLEQFVVWIDGTDEAGVTKTSAAQVMPPPPERLRQWYAEDRALASSSMVPIPDTYLRYEAWATAEGGLADEAAFRLALESLYNAGEAILEPCERPQDLPEAERRLQVPLTFGPPGYYWSPVG